MTTRSPSNIPAELAQAGYRVFEPTDVSEVLHLCETENVDVIVIDADAEDPDVI